MGHCENKGSMIDHSVMSIGIYCPTCKAGSFGAIPVCWVKICSDCNSELIPVESEFEAAMLSCRDGRLTGGCMLTLTQAILKTLDNHEDRTAVTIPDSVELALDLAEQIAKSWEAAEECIPRDDKPRLGVLQRVALEAFQKAEP